MAPSEYLKAWRTGKGRTVVSCAADVGVAHPTWLAWEAGTKSPNNENAFKLQKLTRGKIKASAWVKSARVAPPAPVEAAS